jgi:hypothetical protein
MTDIISFVWNETKTLRDATAGGTDDAKRLIGRLARRAAESNPPAVLPPGEDPPSEFEGKAIIDTALSDPRDDTDLPAKAAICKVVADATSVGAWTAADDFHWVRKGAKTAQTFTTDAGNWGLFDSPDLAGGPVFASEITGTTLAPLPAEPVAADAVDPSIVANAGLAPAASLTTSTPTPGPVPKTGLGRLLFLGGLAAFVGSLFWANGAGSGLWQAYETFRNVPLPTADFLSAFEAKQYDAATAAYRTGAASFAARATLAIEGCDAAGATVCDPLKLSSGPVTQANLQQTETDMKALSARADGLRKISAKCITLPTSEKPEDGAPVTIITTNFTVTTESCARLLREAQRASDGQAPPVKASVLWQTLLATLGLVLMFLGAAYGVSGTAKVLIVNQDNRYSLSRTQALAWTLMILPALLVLGAFNSALGGEMTAYLRNFEGNAPAIYLYGSFPYVENALWAAMGIALASAGLSPLLNAMRPSGMADAALDTGASRTAQNGGDQSIFFKNPNEVRSSLGEARMSDFVTGETTESAGKPDVARIQLIFITVGILIVFGAGIYALISGIPTDTVLAAMVKGERAIPSLPTLGAGMAFALLLSHAAYLSAKPYS